MVLSVVGVVALAGSSVLRTPSLRSWSWVTVIVLGPPIASACAVRYLRVLADVVRTVERAD